MQYLKIITNINAPVEKVWSIIGAVGGVDKWSPIINTCTLSSSAEGGLQRICSSDNGELKERILLLNHLDKQLIYEITKQQFFPIDELKTSITITGSNDTTQISTEVRYRLRPGAHAEGIKAGIREVYTLSYSGIKELILETT